MFGLEDLVLAVGGAVGGYVGALLQHRRTRGSSSKPPTARCTCDHGFGFHDRETRRCNAEDLLPQEGNAGYRGYEEWRDCRCLFYDGPVPYPEYFAPELAP